MAAKRYSQARRSAWSDVEAFCICIGPDFTEHVWGGPLFASPSEARRRWPAVRRAVWAQTPRFRIPSAAQVFDGLRFDAADTLRSRWAHTVFPAEEVRQVIEADRVALAAFRVTREARGILDFLDQLAQDLDQIAQQAEAMVGTDAVRRTYPAHAWVASVYGRQAEAG